MDDFEDYFRTFTCIVEVNSDASHFCNADHENGSLR